jgi:hypothetical protein
MVLIDSFRYLLKYARVARSGRLSGDETPSRARIDKEFKLCPLLDIPVAFAFTKADIYAPVAIRSEGLHAPPGWNAASPVRPETTDPFTLAQQCFPELVDFLRGNVRYFRFGFAHSCIDTGVTDAEGVVRISAERRKVDVETRRDANELSGVEELIEFITAYDWHRFQWISMGRVLQMTGTVARVRSAGDPRGVPSDGSES